MIEPEEFLYRLQTQAFAEVPFPLSRKEISHIVEGPFFQFLRQPREIRELLTERKCSDKIRGGEVGLIDRRSEKDRDHKVFLHYNAFAEECYREAAMANPVIQTLFDSLRPLYAASVDTFREIFNIFKPDFPELVESFLPEGANPHVYVRILAYMGVGSLTRDHLDQSGATLPLAESCSGLYIGWDRNHVKDVVHSERRCIFMPGLTFVEETAGQYPPAWHGAKVEGRAKFLTQDQERGTLDKQVTRWAVVVFIHGSKARWSSSNETHEPHPLAIQRAKDLDAGWQPKGQLRLRFA